MLERLMMVRCSSALVDSVHVALSVGRRALQAESRLASPLATQRKAAVWKPLLMSGVLLGAGALPAIAKADFCTESKLECEDTCYDQYGQSWMGYLSPSYIGCIQGCDWGYDECITDNYRRVVIYDTTDTKLSGGWAQQAQDLCDDWDGPCVIVGVSTAQEATDAVNDNQNMHGYPVDVIFLGHNSPGHYFTGGECIGPSTASYATQCWVDVSCTSGSTFQLYGCSFLGDWTEGDAEQACVDLSGQLPEGDSCTIVGHRYSSSIYDDNCEWWNTNPLLTINATCGEPIESPYEVSLLTEDICFDSKLECEDNCYDTYAGGALGTLSPSYIGCISGCQSGYDECMDDI